MGAGHRSMVHHRATQRHTTIHTRTCFWIVGGNWSIQRKHEEVVVNLLISGSNKSRDLDMKCTEESSHSVMLAVHGSEKKETK